MSTKKALKWIFFWMGLAVLFDIGIYIFKGQQMALEFAGGYIIEQTLSIDNLFVFLLIFSSFGIPSQYQRRILTYGIAGAIILRLVFIVLGVAIVEKFEVVLNIFGLLLIISGIKMFFGDEADEDFKDSGLLKLLRKFIPITNELEGEKFLVRKNKILYATPLLAVLILIEFSDIVFAIDSIPAIFSITLNTFIVYTSNIFAILGLRNLYFILEKLHKAFRFVKYGVAFILVFTGIKLVILFFKIEISLVRSISVILVILLVSILASVLIKEKTTNEKN